jgi:nucleotide-binding universal stress UspA family protein
MLPRKILFCTDFSENSEPARDLAVEYAKAFGSELLIIHVVDSSGFPNYADWMMPKIGEELNQLLLRMQEEARSRMASLEEACGKVVKDVKAYCRVGAAPNEIVGLANEASVDLIVIGTHGRTGVKHLVMGSIARSVLRMAHRPVLIVEALTGKGESS